MKNTTLILGPPGCGKTHTLIEVIRDALSRGVSPWEIGFLSFTRKAVNEAAGRAGAEFGLDSKDMPFFKTLHALGFSLLGMKREDVMGPADWKAFGQELGMEVNGDDHRRDDISAAMSMGKGSGDAYLRLIQRATMRGVSLDQEYREAESYDLNWSMLKKVEGLLDVYRHQLNKVTFVDMLKMFVEYGEVPRLRLLIVDEAQDLVPLQWRMVEKLAEKADEIFFAGDDDQAIHRWAGVEVKRFLDCSPNIRLLEQSYRLPRSVFDLSQRVVTRIKTRIPKVYRPMDKEGKVRFETGRDSLDLTHGSWMLMTRANYMAQEWGEQLRDDGYLFSLNGKRSLQQGLADALTTWRSLTDGGEVYLTEVRKLYDQLDAKATLRGAKKLLDAADPNRPYNIDELQRSFGLQAGDSADPLRVVKMNDRERTYIRALERRGEDVTQEPRIKVGTIHSNKGGEDDNVAVDLGSTRAAAQSLHPDDEHRVFYVGFTRAKNNLHVIQSDKRSRYEI
jgi:superfamily I DNA/RNA helicase